MLLIETPPPLCEPELGVIREAQRRRRRRIAGTVATVATASLVAAVLTLAGGASNSPHSFALRRLSAFRRLTGPALRGDTHLQLIGAGNGGAPYILDVDQDTLRRIPGLGVSSHYTPWSPSASISPAPGGALAVVSHQACEHCARSQVLFTVRPNGSVTRIAGLALGSDDTTTPDPGVAAEWVEAHARAGGCTLRLLPGPARAVAAPCGFLDREVAGHLAISTSRGLVFVNPATGGVLEPASQRARGAGQLDPLAGDLALVSSGGLDPNGLALVNLGTGARTALHWPSVIRGGYTTNAQPGGPFVAVTFIDPYDSPSRAPVVDVWVLDTATAAFSHVPGFPAAEDFKQSNVAWAPNGRLVITAQVNPPGGSAVVGVWSPGQPTLPLRAVPVAGGGYYSFVPVFG